jgi:uncharacterized membrane protein
MEGMENPRKLTTRAVGVFLLASLLCLAVGAGLALSAPPVDAAVLPARTIPGELALSNPVAWLSLGALFMILSPSVRVAGMIVTFRTEGDRRAAVAGFVLVTLLLGSATVAIFS